jgi:bud site selection protein 31
LERLRIFAGSRYVYDLYYEKEAISKDLYEWLLKNKYADAALIAKWKKQGYEKVCVCVLLLFGSTSQYRLHPIVSVLSY